jgi:tetratricopeptide (TPR) repeat protein
MPQIDERRITWGLALDDARRQLDPLRQAQLLSLSALAENDFGTAYSNLREAIALDPFQPIHLYRQALLFARFGDFASASATAEQLRNLLPDVGRVNYLCALIALRSGNTDEARGMLASLEAARPHIVQAKFLRAEAQVVHSSRPKSFEKFLLSLPSDAKFEGLWADLFIKIALLHPKSGPALVKKHLGKMPCEGSAIQLVRKALTWIEGSSEDLARELEMETPGSRAEAMLMSCLVNALDEVLDAKETDIASQRAKVVGFLADLRRRHPHRAILKQVENIYIVRMATELAADRQYEYALRLLERCEHRQPQDSVYVQDRAAVFTLLRDPVAYHEAWAELDRQHFRQILLGLADQTHLARVAATHRLFAQQARGNLEPERRMRGDRAGGIFRIIPNDEYNRVIVASDEIAADRDLLRQWIHHSQAELVFRHLALGDNPAHALINPCDRDNAVLRAEAIGSYGQSLETLVPQEGALLSAILKKRWLTIAQSAWSRYQEIEAKGTNNHDKPDRRERSAYNHLETVRLLARHWEVIGDLTLLCRQWSPEPRDLSIAEDLVQYLLAESAFLNSETMRWFKNENGNDLPFAIRILRVHIEEVTGKEADFPFESEDWKSIVDSLAAELLIEMAMSCYARSGGTMDERIDGALTYVDRARQKHPNSPRIELVAARLFVVNDHFEDARRALDRFRRFVDPDDQSQHKMLETADELEEILRRKKREGEKGAEQRVRTKFDPSELERSKRIESLEREVDRSPTKWRLYEDIVHELALAGQYDKALEWADLSVSRCLGRVAQMGARGLAVEARGLQILAQHNPQMSRLYIVEAHESVKQAIEESIRGEEQPHYALLYLLGKCQLAQGEPREAQKSFDRAADLCDRQLHLVVLCGLAKDIDTAYLTVARSVVNTYLDTDTPEQAVEEALAVFGRLQTPTAWLVDFARILFAIAFNILSERRRGNRITFSLSLHTLEDLHTDWSARLFEAMSRLSDGVHDSLSSLGHAAADASMAAAQLAIECYPASAQQAALLVERVEALRREAQLCDALEKSSSLLTKREFAPLLAFLASLSENAAGNPRMIRIRILGLLGLNRFSEAGEWFKELTELCEAGKVPPGAVKSIRTFLQEYPSAALRQVLRHVQTYFQAGDAESALSELEMVSTEGVTKQERMDLTYCRAFAFALRAKVLARAYNPGAALTALLSALNALDEHIAEARGGSQANYLLLYERIEHEIELLKRH